MTNSYFWSEINLFLSACLSIKTQLGEIENNIDGSVMDMCGQNGHSGPFYTCSFFVRLSLCLPIWQQYLKRGGIISPANLCFPSPLSEWESRLLSYDRVTWLCCCWNPNHEYHIWCVVLLNCFISQRM